MTRYAIALITLCLLVPALWADSIDDAEAKRRGVPVAQVQAENALAKEKVKSADLEKRVAELQKKLAEMQGGSAGAGIAEAATSVPAATRTAAPPRVAASGAASGGEELNFDGPREPSPTYDDFVSRYLAGDWEKLGANMEAKKKEIAAMPAGNAADLTYIARAIADGRPLWWNDVKTGKTKQIRQLIWKQAVTVNVQNLPAVKVLGLTAGTASTLMLGWPQDWMESRDPLNMLTDVGMNVAGDGGFVRADGVDAGIWNVLGSAGLTARISPEKIRAMTADQKRTLDRYAGFWDNLMSAYYGTPQARRLVLVESCASFEEGWNNRADWEGRRPLGAALLLDIAQHHERYKALHIEPILGMEALGDMRMVEVFVSKPVTLQLLAGRLTLAEDRGIRDLIKGLADANTRWDVSRIGLPGDQAYDLDPEKDGPLAAERMKVVNK